MVIIIILCSIMSFHYMETPKYPYPNETATFDNFNT